MALYLAYIVEVKQLCTESMNETFWMHLNQEMVAWYMKILSANIGLGEG